MRETAQRRVLVQPDTVEGPPEIPLTMNGENYERVLRVILTNASAMIGVPAEDIGKVVEHAATFATLTKKKGTKAAPLLFGPTAISLAHAWESSSALFQYTTIYRMTSVIKQRYDHLERELSRIDHVDIDTRRNFLSEGFKDAAIKRETAELQFVGQYLPALESGLADLATKSWGEEAPLYSEVLQFLAQKTAVDFTNANKFRRGQGLTNRGQGLSRDEILAHIRDGNIEEARDKLKTLFDTSVL